jgi:hypothetical protein
LVLVALGFQVLAEQQVQIPYSQPLPQTAEVALVRMQMDFLVALAEVLR